MSWGSQRMLKCGSKLRAPPYCMFVYISICVMRHAFKCSKLLSPVPTCVCGFPVYVHGGALHVSLLPPTLLANIGIQMETDVRRQTTKHNHAQFMMQSTDPLSTPLRFMSCNSQSSCNFFLTKKDRSRSSCQHSFINMHERIFILAMRAGATVMLEAMNIQIWKQTTITLHMRIFGTTTVVCYHTY